MKQAVRFVAVSVPRAARLIANWATKSKAARLIRERFAREFTQSPDQIVKKVLETWRVLQGAGETQVLLSALPVTLTSMTALAKRVNLPSETVIAVTLLAFALVYMLSPVDVFPDIPIIGQVDDFALLIAAQASIVAGATKFLSFYRENRESSPEITSWEEWLRAHGTIRQMFFSHSKRLIALMPNGFSNDMGEWLTKVQEQIEHGAQSSAPDSNEGGKSSNEDSALLGE